MKKYLLSFVLVAVATVASAQVPTPANLPPAPERSVIVEPIAETKPKVEFVENDPKVVTELAAKRATYLACKCREAHCAPKCYPVLNYVKRELVDKPVYGVQSALVKAEERRLEKAECRLANKACRCANGCDDCCESKVACEAAKLECRKQAVANKRAALDSKKCTLFGQ
jgi:hypothetical protein